MVLGQRVAEDDFRARLFLLEVLEADRRPKDRTGHAEVRPQNVGIGELHVEALTPEAEVGRQIERVSAAEEIRF